MPLHKTFGVDLGTSTVKIYSQDQDTILTEKNMIAIRNQKQILAVGNEAYGIFEKNQIGRASCRERVSSPV